MKITEVRVYVVETKAMRPVIAEVMTDEGYTGAGEASVGFGTGCYAAAAMIYELAGAHLIGKNPENINAVWSEFYYGTFWGKGAGVIFYSAVSALEQALWDIKGKVLGVPVYQLLGGVCNTELKVYANGWSEGVCETAQDFARRAEKVAEDGYDAMKLYPLSIVDPVRHLNVHHIGRNLSKETIEKSVLAVKETRRAVGDDIDIMVDVTAEGAPSDMIKIANAAAAYNPVWYEEATDPFDIDAMLQIRKSVSIPLAAGERLYTRYGFKRLMEKRLVDIVQPDPGTCGGLMEAFRIASMAEAYQIKFAPHNCGGPVLTAAAIQLAACTGNFFILEIFPYEPELHYEIVNHAFEKEVCHGRLTVPKLPGLGVELVHSVIHPFLVYTVK